MLYFGLYVQLRRGSVAAYTTDESWTYGQKEGVEAFESITFFIRFIYANNFEHLLIELLLQGQHKIRNKGIIIRNKDPWLLNCFL